MHILNAMEHEHGVTPVAWSYLSDVGKRQTKNGNDAEDFGQVPKDVIAFNTVIVACGKGQRWRDALVLMKQLQDHGLLPTVVSYSSVRT